MLIRDKNIPIFNESVSEYKDLDDHPIYRSSKFKIYTCSGTVPLIKIYTSKTDLPCNVPQYNFNETTNLVRVRLDKPEYILDAENGNAIFTKEEKDLFINIMKENWDFIVDETLSYSNGMAIEYDDPDMKMLNCDIGYLPDYSQLPTSD